MSDDCRSGGGVSGGGDSRSGSFESGGACMDPADCTDISFTENTDYVGGNDDDSISCHHIQSNHSSHNTNVTDQKERVFFFTIIIAVCLIMCKLNINVLCTELHAHEYKFIAENFSLLSFLYVFQGIGVSRGIIIDSNVSITLVQPNKKDEQNKLLPILTSSSNL